jgi:chromosome segregation ATPase
MLVSAIFMRVKPDLVGVILPPVNNQRGFLMSEERFDRLESQLSQLIQGMGTMQQDMATKQDLAMMQQNMTVMQQDITNIKQVVSETRTDVAALSSRLDRVEHSVRIEIRDAFKNHREMIDDVNYDLAVNERKTRRLSRRVSRLERIDRDDD